jgi:sec-independent protein translocase protein TatA
MGLDNPLHIAFLLVLMLLVFGAKRLPEMGRSLGEGLRGFKSAVSGEPVVPAIAAPVAGPAVAHDPAPTAEGQHPR